MPSEFLKDEANFFLEGFDGQILITEYRASKKCNWRQQRNWCQTGLTSIEIIMIMKISNKKKKSLSEWVVCYILDIPNPKKTRPIPEYFNFLKFLALKCHRISCAAILRFWVVAPRKKKREKTLRPFRDEGEKKAHEKRISYEKTKNFQQWMNVGCAAAGKVDEIDWPVPIDWLIDWLIDWFV